MGIGNLGFFRIAFLQQPIKYIVDPLVVITSKQIALSLYLLVVVDASSKVKFGKGLQWPCRMSSVLKATAHCTLAKLATP